MKRWLVIRFHKEQRKNNPDILNNENIKIHLGKSAKTPSLIPNNTFRDVIYWPLYFFCFTLRICANPAFFNYNNESTSQRVDWLKLHVWGSVQFTWSFPFCVTHQHLRNVSCYSSLSTYSVCSSKDQYVSSTLFLLKNSKSKVKVSM